MSAGGGGTSDGLYLDNGDGTSSVMSLWQDGFGHGNAEVDVYVNSQELAQILTDSTTDISASGAPGAVRRWEELMEQAATLRDRYGDSLIPQVLDNLDSDLESLQRKHGSNPLVKILSHDEFADRFAVLSLRDADSARKAEETLTAAMDKLSEMGEQIDAAYDSIQEVVDRRAESPDGYSRMGELDRLFKPLDDLWRISHLWGDGTARYLIA